MRRRAILLLLPLLLTGILLGSCQTSDSLRTGTGPVKTPDSVSGVREDGSGTAPERDLDEVLPVDPDVLRSTLDNGLTYYIRKNGHPDNRAELRLVVNAGSVLESEDQRGLAHFLEHMAFNGTKNFDKQEIVDYLESIGMRFGPDLNAYTTYDETVFSLQIPTDREGVLETAIQILRDWAGNMTLDEEEIDKERGVIVEEWRERRNAQSRIWDKQLPVLLYGSRYAERRPIGKMEVVRNFDPRVLRRFYKDWYRPELMAVVAVGDFDPAEVEKIIAAKFSTMKSPSPAKTRPSYDVPDHDRTLFSVVTDKEATEADVRLVIKQDVHRIVTAGDYRRSLLESLYHLMLNERLYALTRSPDAPFLDAYSGKGRYVRAKEFYILGARVRDDRFDESLRSLLTEAERVRLYGFTQPELDRQKRELLSFIERAYNERNTTDSARYAREYVGNFLEGETIPGIEMEYRLYRELLPGITLADVNDFAQGLITERNRVVLVSAPQKEGIHVPDDEELAAVIGSIAGETIKPYQEKVKDLPLISGTLPGGKVVSTRDIPEIGTQEWTLSNGVRVILKPTKFKEDQILMAAYSPGGHSLASDADYVAAVTADDLVNESGVGDFNSVQLDRRLAGMSVSVTPWIREIYEGMNGSSSVRDVEPLFQLVYLYFTAPRIDQDAFEVYRQRLTEELKNRRSSPESLFWDTLIDVVHSDHPRARPWKPEMLEQMDVEKSLRFYRDRFSDASDFTFFFVGSFTYDSILPLVETYLGSLPSTGRIESWRDLNIDPPEGVVVRRVRKGTDPKSMVYVAFNGDFQWRREDVFLLDTLADVIEIPLRESLREEAGGTYGVGVFADPSEYPDQEYRFYIGFGTSPDKVDHMVDLMFRELRRIREEGPREENIKKVQEILRRERETHLEQNEFWLNVLQSYDRQGIDPRLILSYDKLVDLMGKNSLRDIARRYIDFDRYVEVILYPSDN